MQKLFSATFLLLTFFQLSMAQTALQFPATTPPNAASFTQYSKVPVGEFTGIADIKVPLYDIKVDNLHIPVYLSYYAKGVQPNVHSGWVGTGWSLTANGVITRKMNGLPDECQDDRIIGYGSTGNYINHNLGWYYSINRIPLQGSSWASINNINEYCGSAYGNPPGVITDSSPDEFDFSINGISGAFFLGEDGNWKVRSAGGETIAVQATLGADTLQDFPLGVSDYSPQAYQNQAVIRNTFTQFTLIAGDGTRYIFGKAASNGPNTSIDFSRMTASGNDNNNGVLPVAWHITEIDLPSGKKISYTYFRDGHQFSYSSTYSSVYQGSTAAVPPYITNLFLGLSSYTNSATTTTSANLNMSVSDPVYLQSIVFPEGQLVFNSTPSREVDTVEVQPSGLPILKDIITHQSTGEGADNFFTYVDLDMNINTFHSNIYEPHQTNFNTQSVPISNWYKLNDIELDDYNGKKLKDIKLMYTKDVCTRLFLSSVQEYGYYNNTGGVSLPPYTFTYNAMALPPYASLHTDHWGFYNGPASVHAFPALQVDAHNFVTTNFQKLYYNFRQPDTNYVQAGILTKIVFPTGGYSQFSYQPNTYRKWVGGLPPTVTTQTADSVGAGVRVWKIVTTDNANLTPVTYVYNYATDLTSNISSGVLGMQRPTYSDVGSTLTFKWGVKGAILSTTENVNYNFWSTNAVYPSQNDDGNIVTYSNVIERQSGNGTYNGMKVSVFSNHDNGYANNPPDMAEWTFVNEMDLYHYSDRAFERGMLLSETTYDQNNNPIKKIQNTYNTDTTRFNIFARSIYSSIRMQSLANVYGTAQPFPVYFTRNSAIRNYVFYPFLQQTVETVYATDGSGSHVGTTKNFAYDPNWNGFAGTKNLIQTQKTDSKGQTVTNKVRYPLDFSLSGITSNNVSNSDIFTQGLFNLQSNFYAVSTPVESIGQFTDINGNVKTTGAMLNSFDSNLPFPAISYKAAITNPSTALLQTGVTIAPNGSGIQFGTLSKDATYEPRTYVDHYDSYGNIIQEHTANGANQAYQWGYNHEYLVAVVKNAAEDLTTDTTITNGTGYGDVYPPASGSGPYTSSFTATAGGNIPLSLAFSSYRGQANNCAVVVCTINGTTTSGASFNSNQVQLCVYAGGPACSTVPSTGSIAIPAAGNYTLNVSYLFNPTLSSGVTVYVAYSYAKTNTTITTTGVNDVFYDSFEEGDGNSALNVSKTGHYSFIGTASLPYTQNMNNLDTGKYTLSYWLLSGGTWTLQTSTVPVTTSSYSVRIIGQIDDVRFYPAKAMMTTYTYDPLVGMTSSTDEKNQVTYYDYDSLLRMMSVRDKDGNIIKHLDYHYQGQ